MIIITEIPLYSLALLFDADYQDLEFTGRNRVASAGVTGLVRFLLI
jgi:hypothetical protein